MYTSYQNYLKLVFSAIIGIGFFGYPLTYNNKSKVIFDIAITWLRKEYSLAVSYYAFLLIAVGALISLYSICQRSRWQNYRTSYLMLTCRLIGLVLAGMMLWQIGPDWLLDKKITGLMWTVLIASVALIIPIGAVFLNVFIQYGCLEFVGTLMRPIMRPLFKLPGRSALDDITSWLGSYSVGLYVTRKLFYQGYYTRRETFTIVTCFSTVSIGFVGVICATLDLLALFPLVFATYFIVIYLLTFILVRLWPIAKIPNSYYQQAKPEEEIIKSYWHSAMERALTKAQYAPSFWQTIKVGFVDGLQLATTILGTILAIGTLALVIAEYTPIFNYLAYPVTPILKLFNIPDAKQIAPAVLAGITEMYIPAILAQDASLPARFFIAVLSISQVIFFSSVAPMMLDMFGDVPIRFYQLILLFILRTLLLIPLLAGFIVLYQALNWL